MIVQILILFFLAVTSNCSIDNEGILLQISSEKNCNKDKLFKNFTFINTPQFSAMCNIPVPNKKEVDILLQNNVVPILCMGVYEVSIRLCSEASGDIDYFKDIFPPSTDKLKKIFNTLKQSDEYSDLSKFCSITVKKHKSISSSNISSFWWRVFSNNLDNETCIDICRTNEINSVHPLCSYIIWSNDMILNHQKTMEESVPKGFEDADKIKPDVAASAAAVLPTYIEESAPTGYEEKPPSTSELKDTNSVQVTLAVQKFTQADSTHEKLNSTNDSIALEKLPVAKIEQKEIAKPTQNISSGNISSNDTNSIKSNVTEENPVKKGDNTKSEGHKPTGEENKVAPLGANERENPKPEVKYENQLAGDEIADDTNQNNLNGEINVDSAAPSEQTVSHDPETLQQFDEELDDVDDDVNIEVTPEKVAPKKNGITSDISKNPNGKGKPDEVYSEVERTVLLNDPFVEAEDSHFFTYFLFMSILTIMAYLAFHNKNKLLALAVEGRRSKSSRRRPNSSNYSKLDCSLEEAMVSNTTASVTHVLY